MAKTENIIQELINGINSLPMPLLEESLDNDQIFDLYIENISNIFQYLKELPQEVALLYETQMRGYCDHIYKIIESLQAQQVEIQKEIDILSKKIKAHTIYAK